MAAINFKCSDALVKTMLLERKEAQKITKIPDFNFTAKNVTKIPDSNSNSEIEMPPVSLSSETPLIKGELGRWDRTFSAGTNITLYVTIDEDDEVVIRSEEFQEPEETGAIGCVPECWYEAPEAKVESEAPWHIKLMCNGERLSRAQAVAMYSEPRVMEIEQKGRSPADQMSAAMLKTFGRSFENYLIDYDQPIFKGPNFGNFNS